MFRVIYFIGLVAMANAMSGLEARAQEIQLDIPGTLSGMTETKVDLVIGVSFTEKEISNFDMRLSFNPAIIAIDVEDVNLGSSVSGSFSRNVTSDHRILLAFASASAIKATDSLIVISGRLLSPGEDAKGITIKDWFLGDGRGSVNVSAPVDIRVVSQQSTSIESEPSLPDSFDISSIHPNPFNPSSTIRYRMVEAGPVKMDIIDSQGRIVMQLFEGHRQAGEHEVVVNGTELTSGVYFARIVTDQGMRIRPFSMIK